jgi:hypothetical protein
MLQRQATRYLSRVETDAPARQVDDPEEQRFLKKYVVGFAFSVSDSVSDSNGISPFRQDTALQLIFEAIDLERCENDDEYLTLSDLSMCLAMPLPVLFFFNIYIYIYIHREAFNTHRGRPSSYIKTLAPPNQICLYVYIYIYIYIYGAYNFF